MIFRYLFSSADGDIPAEESVLDRPFLLSPSEEHPTLTLRDYFKTLERFLLLTASPAFPSPLRSLPGLSDPRDEILEVLIRSEKHGALYQIASGEIVLPGRRFRFAVVSALSKPGKATLHQEFEALRLLHDTFSLPYLPEVYLKNECPVAGEGHSETLVMVLQEWFEGYHEWHFSGDERENASRLCIWDLEEGNRFASDREKHEIFRQASRILTLYYDPRSSSRIHPWHHAAGDFIVKSSPEGKTDVRLTTVRSYAPMFDFSDEEFNPWTALVFFFLDLTIRMRLDRLDGVGEPVWAGDFVVDATLEGFFEGLKTVATDDRFPFEDPREVISLLKAFSKEELLRLMPLLLDEYEKRNPGEVPFVSAHQETHAARLIRSIGDFSL